MENTEKKRSKWWRYLLSAVVFVIASDFLPLLFGVIYMLLDIITPKYYRSGFAWICVIAYGLTPIIALNLAALVCGRETTKKDAWFYMILSALWMAWCGFTAVRNYTAGIISFEVACGMWVEVFILLVFVLVFLNVVLGGKFKLFSKIEDKIISHSK